MSPLHSILWGGLGLGAMLAISTGWSLVHELREADAELAALKHEASLSVGRLASYKRMIDRRDAAIDASACKAQITRWVSHPDEVPRPFNPFDQLK